MKEPLKTLVEIDRTANNTDLIKIHRQRSWDGARCANCNLDVNNKTLNDAEYKISALCLECQKEFFKEHDDY
tara:strand:- start:267 stop:482 length:216 start_codon:yes stop_codon:yes gene_type:complete